MPTIRQAIELARRLGSRVLEAEAQNCLGDLRYAADDLDGALAGYDAALTLSGQDVDRYEEAHALEGSGTVLLARDQRSPAMSRLIGAERIYASLGTSADLVRVRSVLDGAGRR